MRLSEVVKCSDHQMAADLAARIAQKYQADQYDLFAQEIQMIAPKHLLALMNLPQMFDLYNPGRQKRGAEIWDMYMKDPKRIDRL